MGSTEDNVNISLKYLSLRFEFIGKVVLPKNVNHSRQQLDQIFGAKVWRGVIGAQLRKSVCTTDLDACNACDRVSSCSYPLLFESRAGDRHHVLNSVLTIPQPYVMSVDNYSIKSDHLMLCLSVVLFGSMPDERVLALLAAIKSCAATGVGNARTPFILKTAQAQNSSGSWKTIEIGEDRPPAAIALPMIPACPDVFNFEFITPMRIVKKGKLVLPDTLCFSDIFSVVLRRISSLSAYYGEPLCVTKNDFKELMDCCKNMIRLMGDTLELESRHRWSGRQQRRIPLDGIVGSVSFTGDSLCKFWPYVYQAQWLHAGKSTTMGLGKYRVHV